MYKYWTIIILAIIINAEGRGQPQNKMIWVRRAVEYAKFWSTTTTPGFLPCPEYHYYQTEDYPPIGVDCANFVSQIMQAGCSGLCEFNVLNPTDDNRGRIDPGTGWDEVTFNIDCNHWWDQDANIDKDEDRCYPKTVEYNNEEYTHYTVINALSLVEWLLLTKQWPYRDLAEWPKVFNSLTYEGDYATSLSYFNETFNILPPVQDLVDDAIFWVPETHQLLNYKSALAEPGYVCIVGRLYAGLYFELYPPEDYDILPPIDEINYHVHPARRYWQFHAMFISDETPTDFLYCAHSIERRDSSLRDFIRSYANEHYWQVVLFFGGGTVNPDIKKIVPPIQENLQNSRIPEKGGR